MQTFPLLTSGDRVYYTGDQANDAAWLTVTAVAEADRCYELVSKDGRVFSRIFDCQIGREYHGHCNPRFVTGNAYDSYRAQQLAALEEFAKRYRPNDHVTREAAPLGVTQ